MKWIVDVFQPIISRTISAVNPYSSDLAAFVDDLQAAEHLQASPQHDGTDIHKFEFPMAQWHKSTF